MVITAIITTMFFTVLLTDRSAAMAASPYITMASTTSTKNSGLYDYLLPEFTRQTGIEVRVIAVGTGQAIRLAKAGDADVLLVHHTTSEMAFVVQGFGMSRRDVMYNDFVIIGPASDPASIRNSHTTTEALKSIASSGAVFISRGDDSGTNKKELDLWQQTGLSVKQHSGTWYRETGSGMGTTLNTASGMAAYTLSDRATWLKFANKGDLEVLVEGDPDLFNQYGIILVNKTLHPHTKAILGQTFIDWIIGKKGQDLINRYRIDGHKAFFANAKTP
jgi:tungstate transport system substrate-binding protein